MQWSHLPVEWLVSFVKDVTVALAAAVVAALVSVTGFVVNQPPVASVRQANRGLAGGVGVCRGRGLFLQLGTMQPVGTWYLYTVCARGPVAQDTGRARDVL